MIPINVGVTGHRDLSKNHVEAYRLKCYEILQAIKKTYPNSPIQVLTALAEGADLLIAQIALELGFNLIVILPKNLEAYINDFEDKQHRYCFLEMLDQATQVIDLSKEVQVSTDPYENLGVYVVNHSQMLLALWNGRNNGKPGGTASVISYALRGLPYVYRERHHILDLYDSIPVYYIPVIRERHDMHTEDIEAITCQESGYRILYSIYWRQLGTQEAKKYYQHILMQLDDYNRESIQVSEGKINDSMKHLADTYESKKEVTRALHEYAVADQLAQKKQRKTISLLKWQLLCGFLVFFWVTVFDELFPGNLHILFLVPLFFIITYLIYRITSRRGIENKYYDYRALSEGLRVQYYWKLAGLKDKTYEAYSRKNKRSLTWIIVAMSNIYMEDMGTNMKDTMDQEVVYRLIEEKWLENQYNFYKKRYIKTAKSYKAQKAIIFSLFGAGLACVMGLYLLIQMVTNQVVLNIGTTYFLFFCDTTLAIGAIFSGYLEKRQYAMQNKQYKRMIQLYHQALKEYKRELSHHHKERLLEIIIEIGQEALIENGDWVTYNRANSIDMPLG